MSIVASHRERHSKRPVFAQGRTPHELPIPRHWKKLTRRWKACPRHTGNWSRPIEPRETRRMGHPAPGSLARWRQHCSRLTREGAIHSNARSNAGGAIIRVSCATVRRGKLGSSLVGTHAQDLDDITEDSRAPSGSEDRSSLKACALTSPKWNVDCKRDESVLTMWYLVKIVRWSSTMANYQGACTQVNQPGCANVLTSGTSD